MRIFLNLFLSLILPVSTLFIALSVGYFMLDYDLSKALRLGTVAGFILGILFSAVMSAVLLFLRGARTMHIGKTHAEENIVHQTNSGPIDKKFILLMDKLLAFDIIIQSVIDQKIGEVGKGTKRRHGNITIFTPEHSINIVVEKLTKHTSEVRIKADNYSEDVKQIITYTKNKENSFLQY